MGENRALSFVARHSFGIYLCHYPFVVFLAVRKPALPVVASHLLLAASLACALAFAWAMDTVVVGPLQKLLDRTVGKRFDVQRA